MLLQAQGNQAGFWRAGLQAVSRSSCGFCGSWVSGWHGRGGQRALGSASLCPLHGSLLWALLGGKASRGPSTQAFCGFPVEHSKALGPGFSLTLCPPSSPQYLPRKSTRKCRWKTLMLTASPSTRRRIHPLPCRCPRLLPNPTHLGPQDQPQGASGHLLCFSWAFHSTVPPVHLAFEDTGAREGKKLAQVTQRVAVSAGTMAPPFSVLLISGFRLSKELSEETLSRIPSIVRLKGVINVTGLILLLNNTVDIPKSTRYNNQP